MKITKQQILGCLILGTVLGIIFYWVGISTAEACECPVKVGDHVKKIAWYESQSMDKSGKIIKKTDYWHCADVIEIKGKCGDWIITVQTCEGKNNIIGYQLLTIVGKGKSSPNED